MLIDSNVLKDILKEIKETSEKSMNSIKNKFNLTKKYRRLLNEYRKGTDFGLDTAIRAVEQLENTINEINIKYKEDNENAKKDNK